MKLVRLSPVLCEKVSHLEARLSRAKLGVDEIRRNLKDVEINNCNLSYALLDKQNELLGYIMSWFSDSQFVIDETVVFIDDLVILPDYENYKYNLIKAVVKNLEEKNLSGTAIEVTVFHKDCNIWINDQNIEEKIGYTLNNSLKYNDDESGEDLVLLRFEPVN
jgi:hypothetical protein